MRNRKLMIVVAAILFGATALVLHRQWRDRSVTIAAPPNAPATGPASEPAEPWRLSPHRNVLVRELFRQGLLLRERDAGLWPRDKSLGDEPAADDLDVDVILRPTVGIDVTLLQHGQPVRATRIPYEPEALDYVELTTRGEALWRGEFAETLAKLGVHSPAARMPSTQPATAPAVLPVQIQEQLAALNILSQWAAVRSAQEWLRDSPESPAVLDALIRGYANLGQLTQFLWSPAHKVFFARSMLYAQRMIVLWPQARNSYQHRAYALAMAGLQADAMADLAKAATLPAATGGVSPWAALLEPYCRYDTAKLNAVATGPAEGAEAESTQSLAAFLAFLTIESGRSTSVTNTYGQAVLKLQPDCLRVIDAMSRVSGVSANHELTVDAPTLWWKLMDRRMESMGDLPPGVKEALDAAKAEPNPSNWAAFATALVNAPLNGLPRREPSWNALGQIIRDVHFVHIYRRADFLVQSLGTQADDFVATVRPLIERHRYRNFIECYAINHGGPKQFTPLLQKIDMIEPDVSMSPLILKLMESKLKAPNHDTNETLNYSQWCLRYTDSTSADLERTVRWTSTSNSFALEFVHSLHRCSPFAPLYMAELVNLDWPSAEPQVPQWDKEWGSHPTLAEALARKYTELKKWPAAEKYLKAYLESAPDYWAFSMLAANYLAQKDEAQWLATMKRVLDQPDYGLFHGRANQQIAEHFMETGRWAKARPYAEAGANTGAGWALVTLAKCCEGSGDWNAAEELIRQEAERYDKPMSWARFCLRTGHGNLQAATAAAKQYLDHPPGTLSDRELLNEQASYFIMMGDAQAALEPLKAATDRMGDPYAALHLALLLDAAGDTAGRDGALRIAVERGPQFRRDPLPTAKPRECFLKLAALFQQCLAGGAAAKLDTHTTDALIESSRSSQDKVNLNYFIARFLELRGDDSGAMPYLKKAAANRNRNATACVMAWIDLRRRGIDPAQIFIAGDDAGAD